MFTLKLSTPLLNTCKSCESWVVYIQLTKNLCHFSTSINLSYHIIAQKSRESFYYRKIKFEQIKRKCRHYLSTASYIHQTTLGSLFSWLKVTNVVQFLLMCCTHSLAKEFAHIALTYKCTRAFFTFPLMISCALFRACRTNSYGF